MPAQSNMRLASVRLKPGVSLDGLSNVLTGLGGASDPRSGRKFGFTYQSPQMIEAAYLGSGLMRKIIDIPAKDSVREWRDWNADEDQVKQLKAEERRLDIRGKVKLAEIYRGLGGGAIILGVPGNPALPMNERSMKKGSITYLHVLSRYQLQLGKIVDDVDDPLFGQPAHFTMNTQGGQQQIHPSRVICFKGDTRPVLTSINTVENFWGMSKIDALEDAVKNSDNAQQAFSALVDKARNTEVGIPGLTELVSTEAGEKVLQARISTMITGQSMFNATLFDAGTSKDDPGEEINHKQVSWVGIPGVMLAFAEYVSAVSDIPMTRLFGRAPEGMNSSGDSQQKDWNKKIRAHQTLEMQACIDHLDRALIPSSGAMVAAENDNEDEQTEISWEWAPLDTPTEKEQADIFETMMKAVEKLQATASIPDQAFSEALQNLMVEMGWLPGMDNALEKIPDDERFGITQTAPANTELGDAKPRSLYVSRQLLNAADFLDWAKGQGFNSTLDADDLHVTILYSKIAVDWMDMGDNWSGDEEGNVTIEPGGARLVEPLGDKGAVVLLFSSSTLTWRHEDMKHKGASSDYPDYQPHVTITYEGEGVDLDAVEPYRGKLEFGPEIFEEIDEDWTKGRS